MKCICWIFHHSDALDNAVENLHLECYTCKIAFWFCPMEPLGRMLMTHLIPNHTFISFFPMWLMANSWQPFAVCQLFQNFPPKRKKEVYQIPDCSVQCVCDPVKILKNLGVRESALSVGLQNSETHTATYNVFGKSFTGSSPVFILLARERAARKALEFCGYDFTG